VRCYLWLVTAKCGIRKDTNIKKYKVFIADTEHDSDSLIKASRIATDALLAGTDPADVAVLKHIGLGECGVDTYEIVEIAEVFSASRHPAGRKFS
jgi:hypothetical protein